MTLAGLRPGEKLFEELLMAEEGMAILFTVRQIHEQPKAIQDTLNSVIKEDKIDLSTVEITDEEIQNFDQIYIVACGSAWHVGMAAQYVFEDLADIPVRVELASEFRYRKMPLNQKALVIVVSQSGETADTLAALRMAKEKNITTMAIVNVVGSSIAREADEHFVGSLAVVPLQLIGYYVSVAKGLDVDKPRNLAKSVTVE